MDESKNPLASLATDHPGRWLIRRVASAAIVILSISAWRTVIAQDVEEPDAARELSGLVTRFDAGLVAHFERLNACASDEDEAAELLRRFGEARVFGEALLALARQDPRGAVGTEAIRRVMGLAISDGRHGALARRALAAADPAGLRGRSGERILRAVERLTVAVGLAPCVEFLQRAAVEAPDRITRHWSRLRLAESLAAQTGDPENRRRATAILAALAEDSPREDVALRTDRLHFELRHLQIGMVAPDFSIEDSTGANLRLARFRGRVVVVYFWGFW